MSGNTMVDNSAIGRLKWQSRRGLLELDLLLSRFWQQHDKTLDNNDQILLSQWLTLNDTTLWALLSSPPPEGKSLAEKINGKVVV